MEQTLLSPSLLAHSYFPLPDGSKLRYGIFPAHSSEKGTMVIIPGRREFIEKKHAELAEKLCGYGYKLIIVEPRGQGLSTRFLSGSEYQRDYIDTFSSHLEDLKAFMKGVVEPNLTSPLSFHGHSQGGHLVLRHMIEEKSTAQCFITAPMLALGNLPSFLAQGSYALSLASVRLGYGTHYAPKQHDFNSEDCEFHDNFLTHDENRFRIIGDYFAKFPELTVGGVTWNWLRAALHSMQLTHEVGYLSQFKGSLLALIGNHDRVTPPAENLQHLKHIPHMENLIVPHARHDILNETDATLSIAWAKIESFLR